MISIGLAKSPDDIESVKTLFLEYLEFIEGFLGVPLDFQNTEAEFANFPSIYDALFLAKLERLPVAAIGYKIIASGICELKRLYCRSSGRGHQLGRRLTETAIKHARANGFKAMYLDTDPGLTHANRLYEALGFVDIAPYYDNPIETVRYMGLDL